MAPPSFAARGLKFELEEKPEETIIHCSGKIVAENSQAFQQEIRDLIPASRGHVAAITCRIVLDLANVTYVDSTGLGALLGAWTSAQAKGCDLEIANLRPRIENLMQLTKLDTILSKIKSHLGGNKAA